MDTEVGRNCQVGGARRIAWSLTGIGVTVRRSSWSWCGSFSMDGIGPQSVRSHGATTCGGADRTTRDAGRRPTDPTWTARGVVAQWATPRDVPTTPIQI